MKIIISTLVLLFSAGALAAEGLYYDMGDDWVKEVDSDQQAIEWDWIGYGNGLCYAGSASDVAKEYFTVGEILETEDLGEVEVTRIYIESDTIIVDYTSSTDGKSGLGIAECSEDLDLP